MSGEPGAFWIVTAPMPNFEDVATINVCNHEIPLPAYWKIVELVAQGRREKDIVQLVIQHTGVQTLKVVTDVVRSIAENQRQMDNSSISSSSSRLSLPFARPKRVSAYRAARLEARVDLEAAEQKLKSAKDQEKKLLNNAIALTRQRERLEKKSMASDERRQTVSAIEDEMKAVLRRHKEVEAEVEYAKSLTVIHRASLA
ncbi:hypothetical protein LTR10_014113 [Elasticomyces elasticus]|uniref:Uncharacterized protein n=1 Tax=Exophiala sideris TaxID=1016849 RepID=A0ABR0J398_9EURO|nr:hypothetical protein LTR10_014113 [Elasticomyces elasticus]KAK5026519.1 hypothetical protein LTS07_007453 [Exophiala sideris]KAK5033740.1 hypothetical protein LTR13_006792 [Exophiala sideris]KAK5055562.1 hypothetical protein LTR69_008395 [Exophiala sideris]KAK5180054.1 hypothetical protein LTR44_007530 [Eurotiomycetes sp. CCFEE 6388]